VRPSRSTPARGIETGIKGQPGFPVMLVAVFLCCSDISQLLQPIGYNFHVQENIYITASYLKN
jgi:hypothetical protein